jgi:hypothetical protein
VSNLRISSEPGADPLLPQPFLPPAARGVDNLDDIDDDVDFGPIARISARALSQLFGVPVNATPGRPARSPDGSPPPRVSPSLAGALATLQLGGDIDQPVEILPTGLAIARQARAIGAVLDGIATRAWPPACRAPGIDLEISVGVIQGHVRLLAPGAGAPEPPPPAPVAALAARLYAMPMRLRVELSAAPVPVRTLLPLRPGTVLPIDPRRQMTLVLGDHAIGAVTLTPTPDGRQQAEIITIALGALEGQP